MLKALAEGEARAAKLSVGNVGLLFVGAVLFMNGLMLLGKVDTKTAAVFNLFAGTLEIVIPAYLVIAANQNPKGIFLASGIYFFGFPYLYVGIGLLMGSDSQASDITRC